MSNYWLSIDDFESKNRKNPNGNAVVKKEITSEEKREKTEISRRNFLKISGYSLFTATVISSCEAPINKAIPFLISSESLTPGIPTFYASTFYDGDDYCSILVKNIDGRPIKIEGNELSGITKGGTNARIQASVLSLYDDYRLKYPLKNNEKTTWNTIDTEIIASLNEMTKKKEKIVIISSSVISPSSKSVFNDFINRFPTTEVVFYDAISVSGIIEANKITFNKECVPSYKFDKTDLIVSFGADFLGTWISPIEFTQQYSSRRKVSANNYNILKHVQFESTLTLTGSNADYRIPINPSDEGIILLNIYNNIAKKAGKQEIPVPESKINIESLSEEIWNNKGRTLIISGSNDVNIQIVINNINGLIGSYGNTIDNNISNNLKQGIDYKMEQIVERLEKNEIKGIIFYNVNPVYDYPNADKIVKSLSKLKLSVSFSETLDETAKLVNYVCPNNHFLESWNDAEPVTNYFSVCQPVINKIFDTRQAQESLLKWIEIPSNKEIKKEEIEAENTFYLYIKNYWKLNIFPNHKQFESFSAFWDNILQKGVFEKETTFITNKNENILHDSYLKNAALNILKNKPTGIEYTLYENIGIGNGKHANNPWLQELPDPISKVCWDNYIAIPYLFAKKYDLKLGDNVLINDLFELPVLIQAGQADNTVSLALGYGRTSAGIVANNVGKNVYPIINIKNTKMYNGDKIKITPTGTNYIFALTQTHHSMEGRNHVRHANLSEYKTNRYAGNGKHLKDSKEKKSLYKPREFKGHHWGLAIDLGLCTGCSACVVACQAENNVSVVGRDEVRNRRIMHWIRIDRYYSEQPENPEVFYQPVMCQQCDNAPCENVCPVEATQNSNEGLNEMVYNRCIGTRYCINNCPYRVRRFNWFEYANNKKFDYNMDSELGKMVLNPEVVVRSRGVVEKCSFCIQRIQEGKLKAKTENRELLDGEIIPACAQSCPAKAMVFGDLSDENSFVSKAFKEERNYYLLEELNTTPTVGYLTKIKNDVNGITNNIV